MLSFSLARRICPPKNQVNIWNRLIFLNRHLILLRGFKEPFSGTLEKISDCRVSRLFETVPGSLNRNVDNQAILKYAQARRICPLKDQINFWNRFIFLSKHLIFPRSLKEHKFWWKFCEKILTAGHLVSSRPCPVQICSRIWTLLRRFGPPYQTFPFKYRLYHIW